MSAGIPASATGTSLFSNLPHAIVSSSPTSVTGLLQQQLSSTAPVSNSSSAYSFGYPGPNSFLVNPYFAAAAAAVAASSPSQGPSAFANFLNPEKQQHQRIKLKRTRQRVDAGEPRNTYTSFIPAYQKTPTYSTSTTLISRPPVSDSVAKLAPVTAEVAPFFGNQSQNSNQSCDLLKKMHLDGIGKEKNAFQSANGEKSKDTPDDEWPDASSTKEAQLDGDQNEESINGVKRPSSRQSQTSDAETPRKRHRSNEEIESNQGDESEKKTASPSSSTGAVNGNEGSTNRSKRKQYQPQQLDMKIASNATNGDDEEDDDESDQLLLSMTTADFDQSDDDHEKSLNGDYDQKDEDAPAVQSKNVKEEKDGEMDEAMGEENELNSGDEGESVLDETEQMEMQRIKRMQGELMYMQQRYIEALAASQQQQKQRTGEKEDPTKDADARAITPLANGGTVSDDKSPPIAKEIKNISEAVKSDLYGSVCRIVDEWMERMQKFLHSETARLTTNRLPQHQPGRQMPAGWPAALEPNRVSAPAPPFSGSCATGSAGCAPPQPVVSQAPESNPASANAVNGPRPPLFFNPFYYNSFPYASAGLNFAAAAAAAAAASGNQQPPSSGLLTNTTGGPTTSVGAHPSTIFPSFPPGGVGPSALGPGSNHVPSPYLGLNLSQKPGSGALAKSGLDDVSCNSLPVARKKRSKVTDTRATKLNFRNDDLGQLHAAASSHQLRGSPAANVTSFFASGAYPPTLLPPHMLNPHQNPFPGASTGLAGNCGGRGSSIFDDSDLGAASPDNSDGGGSEMMSYDPSMPQSITLTPMHLRKAKLMFFYTRYPSSQLLKAYFPDIRFNKNNTAQLVKWFSNFREFYYIQMEKYARQALAEGVRSANEIHVGGESELYKVLNLHYNRNNHIQVPPNFRLVVESTLREFFVAVQASRDAEPSWKKAIYKVIARMDDPIPEYFKTPNFLEQLE